MVSLIVANNTKETYDRLDAVSDGSDDSDVEWMCQPLDNISSTPDAQLTENDPTVGIVDATTDAISIEPNLVNQLVVDQMEKDNITTECVEAELVEDDEEIVEIKEKKDAEMEASDELRTNVMRVKCPTPESHEPITRYRAVYTGRVGSCDQNYKVPAAPITQHRQSSRQTLPKFIFRINLRRPARPRRKAATSLSSIHKPCPRTESAPLPPRDVRPANGRQPQQMNPLLAKLWSSGLKIHHKTAGQNVDQNRFSKAETPASRPHAIRYMPSILKKSILNPIFSQESNFTPPNFVRQEYDISLSMTDKRRKRKALSARSRLVKKYLSTGSLLTKKGPSPDSLQPNNPERTPSSEDCNFIQIDSVRSLASDRSNDKNEVERKRREQLKQLMSNLEQQLLMTNRFGRHNSKHEILSQAICYCKKLKAKESKLNMVRERLMWRHNNLVLYLRKLQSKSRKNTESVSNECRGKLERALLEQAEIPSKKTNMTHVKLKMVEPLMVLPPLEEDDKVLVVSEE